MAEEIVATTYKTSVQKRTETYSASITENLKHSGISVTPNQNQCLVLGVQKMDEVIANSYPKKEWKDLDASSIIEALTQVTILEVNMSSYPSEGYFAIKGNKMTFAPQGEGYRTLVEKYGRNVKRLYEPWIVREGDEFKYPHFKGISIEPPEWTPKGFGKAIRLVFPVEMKDGSIQYLISEREQVKGNLMAHIMNNLTKGQNKDLATYEKVAKKSEKMTLDAILADTEILTLGHVSPAWKYPNTESMVIRKMKNNVLKNFPKDTSNVVIGNAIAHAEDNDDDSELSPAMTIDVSADKSSHEEIDKSVGTTQLNAPSIDAFSDVPKSVAKKEPVKKSATPKPASDDDEELPF